MWFPKPDTKQSNLIMQLDRKTLSIALQVITGHCLLNYHKFLMGEAESMTCDLCGCDRQTAYHLVNDCPAFREDRSGWNDRNTFLDKLTNMLNLIEVPKVRSLLEGDTEPHE